MGGVLPEGRGYYILASSCPEHPGDFLYVKGWCMTGTILKYPGMKNRIADKIISLFPDGYKDMTYLEPFFGSGTVFFRKAPSLIETINDLSEDVYNLFYQMRENGDMLSWLIENTPWSRQEYIESYDMTETKLENARRFLVRCWFSIGAKCSGKTGWRHNIKTDAGYIEGFKKLPKLIQEATYRLRPKPGNIVQIENRDAFILIEKYNRENVLMYLDPPYVLNTRKNKKYYSYEMTNEEHVKLCGLLNESKAKIILSGYENEIYNTHLKNWKKTSMSAYDEKGNRRDEILWINYQATKELFDEEKL